SKEKPRTTVEDEGAEKVSPDAKKKSSDIDSSQPPVTSPMLQSLAPIVSTEDPYVKLGRLESVERQTVLNHISEFEELSERYPAIKLPVLTRIIEPAAISTICDGLQIKRLDPKYDCDRARVLDFISTIKD
ncbi:hypothetical protein ADUPG1_003969, partial [Aduncisulcus paluster]